MQPGSSASFHTASELIDALAQLPPDTPVALTTEEYWIEFHSDGPDGVTVILEELLSSAPAVSFRVKATPRQMGIALGLHGEEFDAASDEEIMATLRRMEAEVKLRAAGPSC